jgi:hypothetical protein
MKLLNFRNNSADNQDTVVVKNKTTNELVAEIHENFFTEVDRLLEEANIMHSTETDKQDQIEKANRLKAFGFNQTKDVVESDAEMKRIAQLKNENESKASLIRAINYFSIKYPQYKFITEDSVKKICQKYGLIYGEVGRYKGIVPDKNLEHIEKFVVNEEDDCYFRIRNSIYGSSNPTSKYLSKKDYVLRAKADAEMYQNHMMSVGVFFEYGLAPLEIAAPLKDFDTKNMTVKDFELSKIQVPDPVVLKPVIFEDKKHYLIVTAWGDEASDELVVNEKMN